MQIQSFSKTFLSLLALLTLGIGACTSVNQESQGTTTMESHSMENGHDLGAMDLGPKDENFDLMFIDGMILHHQGAIAMAKSLKENSQRPEMKQLGQTIISEQEGEIAQMQKWRGMWYPEAGDEPLMHHSSMGHAMAMDDQTQAAMRMDIDLGQPDEEFDLRFINAMVPHHEGAVVMAQQVVENGNSRPELRELAQRIISAQQEEIGQMKELRQQWYGQ
jgi:uncharacterized protein (DUF305 family)